jgi:hypothetical protein
MAPWRHSPSAKAATGIAIATAAVVPLKAPPASRIPPNDAAQITPMSARPRIRRLPSTSLTTGSWARATTSEISNQSTPIARSLMCAVFFANGGRSSDATAIPAPMKTTFSVM